MIKLFRPPLNQRVPWSGTTGPRAVVGTYAVQIAAALGAEVTGVCPGTSERPPRLRGPVINFGRVCDRAYRGS